MATPDKPDNASGRDELPLEKRAVAVCFLFKYPSGDLDLDLDARPQVALFRRSGAVRTHKYAPISGSVEARDASPLATAWRELREETTLTAAGGQLRLFRQGKPYTFSDASVGREWTINPFAFVFTPAPPPPSSSSSPPSPPSPPSRVSTVPIEAGDGGLCLDWEHEGYAWFDPADVSGDAAFGGVPRLTESLRRVWFERDIGRDAARALERGLRALQDDHESGARQLAGKALDAFADVLPRLDRHDEGSVGAAAAATTETAGRQGGRGREVQAWWRNIRVVAWHLWKNGREAMGAPILSVMLASLAIIDAKLAAWPASEQPWDAFVDDVLASLRELAARRTETGRAIGEAFARFLRDEFGGEAAGRESGRAAVEGEAAEGDDAGGGDGGDDGGGGGDGNMVKIVTLSCSSTITAALTHALARPDTPALDVHVLESRPLFEGVKTGRALASALLRQVEADSTTPRETGAGTPRDRSPSRRGRRRRGQVTLHTDSAAAVASQGAHMVLLGADLISPGADVSNKTGSLPLVLSARHVAPRVRVVALAEWDKVLPFAPPGHGEDNDAAEVTAAWPADGVGEGETAGAGDKTATAGAGEVVLESKQGRGRDAAIEVKNVYFEWVPAALVSDYVTEDGVTTTRGIEDWAAEARTRADRFFADL
ncbi:Transcriptional regulatory protein moc3 [Purpureocillium lavendulum]|uniref:Transcriptional regulatory protein moc3 n=1 Tax=Purpureocillium lavendulum TaxID=1247861 RepID=A0AB34FKE2_9HYPO|nr:Transcriptional regulatory protein moc3 [Purpureocillium lavendulum]